MKKKLLNILAIFLFSVGLIAQPDTIQAQDGGQCAAFADRVIVSLGTNCAGLGPNNVCFGSGPWQATFGGPIALGTAEDQASFGFTQSPAFVETGDAELPDDLQGLVTFGQPGNQIQFSVANLPAEPNPDEALNFGFDGPVMFEGDGLNQILPWLESLVLYPFNSAASDWGVAVMNVQANVPSGIGETATYFLMGDVRFENIVPAQEAFVVKETVETTLEQRVTVHAEPDAASINVYDIPAGTMIMLDARSADNAWLHVGGFKDAGWIANENLILPQDWQNQLAVMAASSLTPMQSFKFRTGFADPECESSPPSMIMIQAPDGIPVDIVANGVPLRIYASAFLRTLPGNVMEIVAATGQVVVFADSTQQTIIPVAGAMQFPLGQDLIALDPLGSPTVLTPDVIGAFASLENLPDNVSVQPLALPNVTIASGVGGPEPIVSPPFIPRPTWQPLGIGAGICPAWFFFQSDRDFENVDVYRFGGDWPDDNISDGPTSVDNGPSYSQDSEWVAFVSDRDFTGGKEIFIGKVDGTEQRRVTYSTATDTNPAWGPEGRIAFETNRDGNWEIYTVNLSGYAVPQRLTHDPAYDTNAHWSYDGKYVYFQSNRDGDWEIFRIDVLSGALEQMTDNSLQDAYPIVSHDNNMLAWLQTDPADGVDKLWLMDLATGETRNLTPDFTQDVERIVFSPDDALIAFHSRHNAESEQTDYEVYVVELATDRIKNITDNENIEDMEPNFWCSSLMVLFQSDRNEHEIPGEFDIFEVNPMPIDEPAAEASALVVDDVTNDADPLNTSRQGD